MPALIAGLLALFLILSAIKQFGRLSPADAARLFRRVGPRSASWACCCWSCAASSASRALSRASCSASRPRARRIRSPARFARPASDRRPPGCPPPGRPRSKCGSISIPGRSAGRYWPGRYQGRALASLTGPNASDCYEICERDDPEGARLLETYLDRRFSGWREADESEAQARRSAGGSGAMTRDEAYEILGLAKGASAEEIVARPPRSDEEASSRSWRLDRSGRAGQSGQGCFAGPTWLTLELHSTKRSRREIPSNELQSWVAKQVKPLRFSDRQACPADAASRPAKRAR